MKLYHGSEFEFTEFSYKNIGFYGLYAGFGYYFSSSKIFASNYATGNDSTLMGYDIYFDDKKYNFNSLLSKGYHDFYHGWYNYCFHINFKVQNFNYKNHFIQWCKYGLEEPKLPIKQKKAIQSFYQSVLKTNFIRVELPKYLYEVEIETSKVYYILTKQIANQIIQQLKRENIWTKEIQNSIFTLIGKKIYENRRQSKLRQLLIEHFYNYIQPLYKVQTYEQNDEFLNSIERKISMFFHRCNIHRFAFKVEDVYDYYEKTKSLNMEFLIFDKNSIKITKTI